MSAQGNIFKSVTSWFAPRASQAAPTEIETQDEEQFFLASIAHLSPDEQQQRIQRRAMYQRMAQRQGIVEVEQRTYVYHDEPGQYKWKS